MVVEDETWRLQKVSARWEVGIFGNNAENGEKNWLSQLYILEDETWRQHKV